MIDVIAFGAVAAVTAAGSGAAIILAAGIGATMYRPGSGRRRAVKTIAERNPQP